MSIRCIKDVIGIFKTLIGIAKKIKTHDWVGILDDLEILFNEIHDAIADCKVCPF